MASEKWFRCEPIKNVGDLLSYRDHVPRASPAGPWIFRGTGKEYPLETSLERCFMDAGTPPGDRAERERQILKEFKRRAHHYQNFLPKSRDLMRWFALMQHYGAPTRLLDWTYSFYIAAYFALADAKSVDKDGVEGGEPCIVWALHLDLLALCTQPDHLLSIYNEKTSDRFRGADIGLPDTDNIAEGVNAFLWEVMENPHPCVWGVNSFVLNERQSIQQGVFLCPGDLRLSFQENLMTAKPSPATVVCFKLSTERKARSEMLSELHRMNINHSSLFPGLSGFAASLKVRLWVPEALRMRRSSQL